jgi:hypothetical protein
MDGLAQSGKDGQQHDRLQQHGHRNYGNNHELDGLTVEFFHGSDLTLFEPISRPAPSSLWMPRSENES